ncbi:MAG: DUF1549 domain-containing protein, partial [Verrucomicrobia bacterium]|nr:DUF1549 domain-containing protein [Verrucomicrobiota bacterium]
MSSAAFPVTHRSLRRIGCILIFAAMMMSAVIPDGWSAPGFNQHVRPILAGRCFQCHGPDSGSRKAGLRLDKPQDASLGGKSGKPAIVPGDPGASELLRRITHPDPDLRMPPSELLHPITDQEIRILKEWIESGAKYEVHWAFQPIHRPVIPNHESQSASVNPIDAFIDARLGREGLRRSLPANPRTLLRRLHLDLTGIPPTLEEQESFLKACSADTAHAVGERVDQLLASVRFGEHMAAEWLDIARYADTSGFQGDPYRSMWRWRDYVIESFNAGKPFNQFTLEQLAGDLLPNPTLDQHLATGFNRNHRFNTEFGSIDEEWLVEYGVDRVETMGAAWMGLSLGCARCHDHKFDPVTQTEFYQLMALFQNIPERGVYWDGNDAAFAPWIRAPKPDEASKLQALSRASDQAGGALDQRRASQELSVEFSEWESRHSIAARKAVAEMSTAGRSFSPAGVLAIPTNVMVHFAFETGLAARSGQRIESIATSVTTTNKLEEGISVVTTQHDSQLKHTRFDERIGVAGAGPGLLSEGRLGNGLRLVPNRASLSLSNLVDRGVISIAFWLKPGSSNGFIFHHVAQ